MIKNTYYESKRDISLKNAGLKIKDKLLELKSTGNDKNTYTNTEIIEGIIEVKNLLPLSNGEINYMCSYAGVEYEQE